MADNALDLPVYANFRSSLSQMLGLSLAETAHKAQWLSDKIRKLMPQPRESAEEGHPWRYWAWAQRFKTSEPLFALEKGEVCLAVAPPPGCPEAAPMLIRLEAASVLAAEFAQFIKMHYALRELHKSAVIRGIFDRHIDFAWFAHVQQLSASAPAASLSPSGELKVRKRALSTLNELLDVNDFRQKFLMLLSVDSVASWWANEGTALYTFVQSYRLYLNILVAFSEAGLWARFPGAAQPPAPPAREYKG